MLHTSDCHLGAGGGRREAAFAALVDTAVAVEADAVVVAGDLFDHARVPDDVLDWTVAELDRLPCPTVLLPGNHDLSGQDSVWHRLDPGRRCRDAHLITAPDGELVDVPGTPVVVWGRAMTEHTPAFRPLGGVPPKPRRALGVVAGHGLVLDADEPTERGSPITPGDLAAVDWDYVALGHAGAYREVRDRPTPARYAGETANSRDGVPGAVLVDLEPGGATPRWIPLASPG